MSALDILSTCRFVNLPFCQPKKELAQRYIYLTLALTLQSTLASLQYLPNLTQLHLYNKIWCLIKNQVDKMAWRQKEFFGFVYKSIRDIVSNRIDEQQLLRKLIWKIQLCIKLENCRLRTYCLSNLCRISSVVWSSEAEAVEKVLIRRTHQDVSRQ